jgi:hypothetical protein
LKTPNEAAPRWRDLPEFRQTLLRRQASLTRADGNAFEGYVVTEKSQAIASASMTLTGASRRHLLLRRHPVASAGRPE